MTDFEGQVLGDLQVLKAQMEQIMGIGQPGRLHNLEDRLNETETAIQKMRGVVAAFGAVVTMLHVAISYISGKHS
jgi:hypothetical protein